MARKRVSKAWQMSGAELSALDDNMLRDRIVGYIEELIESKLRPEFKPDRPYMFEVVIVEQEPWRG